MPTIAAALAAPTGPPASACSQGIILSPMGRNCVSRLDKDLVGSKGLAVVDCSWNRLDDVPWGEPAQQHLVTAPSAVLGYSFYDSSSFRSQYKQCWYLIAFCGTLYVPCACVLGTSGGALQGTSCHWQAGTKVGKLRTIPVQGESRATRRVCCPGYWQQTPSTMVRGHLVGSWPAC